MIEETLIVRNKFGIHARPATQIVTVLSQYKSKVTFIKDGTEANAKSILNLLMLVAEHLSKIHVIVDGEDEKIVIQEVKTLLSQQTEN